MFSCLEKNLRLNGLCIRYYILNIYLKLHYVTSLIKKKTEKSLRSVHMFTMVNHWNFKAFLNNDLTKTKSHDLYMNSESEVWLDKNGSQKFWHTRSSGVFRKCPSVKKSLAVSSTQLKVYCDNKQEKTYVIIHSDKMLWIHVHSGSTNNNNIIPHYCILLEDQMLHNVAFIFHSCFSSSSHFIQVCEFGNFSVHLILNRISCNGES